MNRFVIVDGLPYLYANGKTYKVRWDDAGFSVGDEVKLKLKKSQPAYSELEIKAKCVNLDSIKEPVEEVIENEIEEPVEEVK